MSTQTTGPRDSATAEARSRALWRLAALSFAVFLVIGHTLRQLDAALQQISATETAAGFGILDFEFAFTAARAEEILGRWRQQEAGAERAAGYLLGRARVSLILDFAFIPAYALLVISLCLLAERYAAVTTDRRLRWWLVAGPATAGLCDVVENLLLLNAVRVSGGGAAPAEGQILLAGIAASVKFLLLGQALVLLLALAVVRALRHWPGRPPSIRRRPASM